MPPEPANACSQCGRPLSEAARFCERCGTPTHVPADDGMQPIREGDVLDGKWRIERKLGTGGMGTVFLALDLALDRRVAIKALAPALCADTEFLARFEREARATARLEHPNIVPVYAVARHFGRPFIVMKRLTGQSLAYWLRSVATRPQRPGRNLALPLLKQMAAGLGAIHAAGFVHRDLKPGNVYVGEDGHVTILDFGILRDSGAAGQNLTRAGVPLGTPHYMAPEQAWGAKDVDGRADTYALGGLFYEILSGQPPFDDPDPSKLMRMHASQPPPSVCALVPAVPPGVALAIQKAMAKKREDRFPTPMAFYEAVENEWPPADKAEGTHAPNAPTATTAAVAVVPTPAPSPEPAEPEAPSVPVMPLIDEPESLHGKPGEPSAPAPEHGEEKLHLSPRKVTRSGPRPLPQPVMQPEGSEKDLALPETKAAKKRTLFIVALAVEALVVIGILAWVFWPSAPKDEPAARVPEPVVEPAPPPKKDPATPPKTGGLRVVDPALPTNPSDPKGTLPSLDPMKPPPLDLKPLDAPPMPKLDPVPGLAPPVPSAVPAPAPAPAP
ncbi:MAG: serine/threonine-protein kinase [Myxococcales bacterium]